LARVLGRQQQHVRRRAATTFRCPAAARVRFGYNGFPWGVYTRDTKNVFAAGLDGKDSTNSGTLNLGVYDPKSSTWDWVYKAGVPHTGKFFDVMEVV
jgi:hypothetical protein